MTHSDKAAELLEKCRALGLKIATAESCTGGMIAAALTDIPGSSDVFDRGFVTYSNAAKHEMLGVAEDVIEENGAVSAEVARAMAQGAVQNSAAQVSVSVTGIAGPGGGTAEKPVGLVHIAAMQYNEVFAEEYHFQGTREEIRNAAVEAALDLLLTHIG